MLSHRISLKPASIARVLGIIAFLLVLASSGVRLVSYLTGQSNIVGLASLFNVDAEQNIPTFFSTFLLLFADLLLWIITNLKRNQKDPYVSYWRLLSFGFLFMAVDEASSIHELLVHPIRALLGNGNLGFFYFSWVVPGIALVFVLALLLMRFVARLPSRTRLAFLIAATLYLGGAIGLELIGGLIYELNTNILLYKIVSTIEESLEMAGIIFFIWALLEYLGENFKEVQFMFDPERGKGTPGDPKA